MKTKKAYNSPEIQVVMMKYQHAILNNSPASWNGEVSAHSLEDDEW